MINKINDWGKFKKYETTIFQTLKRKFNTQDSDTFYDNFKDAYLEGFEKFENNYDNQRSSNEIGFLYKIVSNIFLDLLKKSTKNNLDTESLESYHFLGLGEPAEVELVIDGIGEDQSHATNDFLLNLFTNRSLIKLDKHQDLSSLKKNYIINSPLIKREAWVNNDRLNQKSLIDLANKINADHQSGEHFDLIGPIYVVRLICWSVC